MTVAERTEIVSAIREWVDAEVIPSASELEHADSFPDALVEQMKELGLFGVIIPEEYGGLGLDLTTYVLIQIELSRGWMSLSGVLNTHFLSAWMIERYGTDDQRQRYLPRMATGDVRSAYSMTEPHAGSDVQAIRTSAVREGDDYVITGQKMWATNGLRAGLVMLLAKTDPDADPPHRGMTAFVLEKEPGVAEQPGLTIPPPLKKLGYKGVESTELVFDGFRTPASSVLGGEAGVGQGFKYFMGAIELGRVNIAARRRDRARFEEAIGYAQEREAFGKPIADTGHSAQARPDGDEDRGLRLLTMRAAERKDAGDRADLEAGMAKLFATETAPRSRSRRCASTAATATRRSSSSSGSTATPRAHPRRGLERDPAARHRAPAPRAPRAADGLRGTRADEIRAAVRELCSGSRASTGAASSPTATPRSSSPR